MSNTPGFCFEKLSPAMAEDVLGLYRTATAARGGLARTRAEMDIGYVRGFLTRASADGLSIGARSQSGVLCGEIHAYRMGPAQFRHVRSDLTVAVHPDWQGHGIGSRLFDELFRHAAGLSPRIERIELMVREGNADAVRLYRRLGFVLEGRFARRVRLPNGATENDLAMARFL
jgi:putative acetyltransferase